MRSFSEALLNGSLLFTQPSTLGGSQLPARPCLSRLTCSSSPSGSIHPELTPHSSTFAFEFGFAACGPWIWPDRSPLTTTASSSASPRGASGARMEVPAEVR